MKFKCVPNLPKGQLQSSMKMLFMSEQLKLTLQARKRMDAEKSKKTFLEKLEVPSEDAIDNERS
jgi:hypothetical protein